MSEATTTTLIPITDGRTVVPVVLSFGGCAATLTLQADKEADFQVTLQLVGDDLNLQVSRVADVRQGIAPTTIVLGTTVSQQFPAEEGTELDPNFSQAMERMTERIIEMCQTGTGGATPEIVVKKLLALDEFKKYDNNQSVIADMNFHASYMLGVISISQANETPAQFDKIIQGE